MLSTPPYSVDTANNKVPTPLHAFLHTHVFNIHRKAILLDIRDALTLLSLSSLSLSPLSPLSLSLSSLTLRSNASLMRAQQGTHQGHVLTALNNSYNLAAD